MPLPESEMPFDGLRYYRESIETGQAQRQFTTLDADHAQFGIGRYACPGRYMASMQIKFVVARTIMNYDLKFPEEQGVPKVCPNHGILSARLLDVVRESHSRRC